MNKLVGFTYNKDGKASNYIYRRNLQGDIIGIYDSLGNEVGWYTSVSGLTNVSFWTGLGPSGETIAGVAANEKWLITIGQTLGGKCVSFLTELFGKELTEYLWASLSKTMASTVAMSSVIVFYGGVISSTSIYMIYEYPELMRRGIEIIQQLIGG